MRGTVGVAPGTTTLMLDNGQAIALEDWIDDKLYGTVQLSNGMVTPVEAFSASRSQVVPGGARVQTRVDTNIPRAGDSGLPKDWEMYIYSIGIRPVRVCRSTSGGTNPILADTGGAMSANPTLATLFQIDRLTFVQFEYNGKAYTQGVMTDYPPGAGYGLVTTGTDIELAQNGRPSPRDRTALVLPIHMKENLGYKMPFQPEAALVISQAAVDEGTALTFMDVRVTLQGLVKRTVV